MKVLTRLRFKGQWQKKQHLSNDHVEDPGQIKINHPVIDNKRRPTIYNFQSRYELGSSR